MVVTSHRSVRHAPHPQMELIRWSAGAYVVPNIPDLAWVRYAGKTFVHSTETPKGRASEERSQFCTVPESGEVLCSAENKAFQKVHC